MQNIIVIGVLGLMTVSMMPQLVSSAPGNRIRILKHDFESDGIGNYGFAYETENGISHHEEGHVEHDEGKVVKGSYSYTGDDGKVYTVEYYADESGFHASGDHLPGSHSTDFSTRNNIPKIIKARPVPTSVNTKLNGYPYEKPSIAYLPFY